MERSLEEQMEMKDMDFASTLAITPRKTGGFVVTNKAGVYKLGERLTLDEAIERIRDKLGGT